MKNTYDLTNGKVANQMLWFLLSDAADKSFTAGILASIPKCPIDFEIKFCQTRSKPQDGVRMSSGHLCEAEAPTEPTGETMSPVEDLQRRMTIF